MGQKMTQCAFNIQKNQKQLAFGCSSFAGIFVKLEII